MGIFSKGVKDISLKDNKSDYLVEKIKTQNSSIFFGANLKVPENFAFIVGKNGKALDCFSTGEYTFDYSNLPLSCKKLKIGKTDETKKNRFVADAYFVNLNYIGTNWNSFKIIAGNRAEGFIKYSFGGKYTFKVTNEKIFMQSLLNELSYIKTGEAEKIVDGWIDDEITKLVDKNMFTVEQIVNNAPVIHEKLFEIMKKMFESAGIELINFDIDYYKLPKVYQKQNDEAIKKQKNENETLFSDKQTPYFKPFGNFIIKSCKNEKHNEKTYYKDDESVSQEEKLSENSEELRRSEEGAVAERQTALQQKADDIKEEKIGNTKAFVDLNTENLYNTKVENIICQFCGEINDNAQEYCKSCGNLLRSE